MPQTHDLRSRPSIKYVLFSDLLCKSIEWDVPTLRTQGCVTLKSVKNLISLEGTQHRVYKNEG